jgi:hypothetical protein
MRLFTVTIASLALSLCLLIAVLFLLPIYEPEKLFELDITGGFANMQIHVDFLRDGTAVYNNTKTGFSGRTQASSSQLEELERRIKILTDSYPNGLELEAEPSSADYFNYNMKVYGEDELLTFIWTDTSKKPTPLTNVANLVSDINQLIVRNDSMIVLIKPDKEKYNEGEKATMKVEVSNPTQNDFEYSSPTPCHPDIKVLIMESGNTKTEIFPIGMDIDKTCIQVIQGRVLKSGSKIELEYEYTFQSQGEYLVEASFPYNGFSQYHFQSQIIISVSP